MSIDFNETKTFNVMVRRVNLKPFKIGVISKIGKYYDFTFTREIEQASLNASEILDIYEKLNRLNSEVI